MGDESFKNFLLFQNDDIWLGYDDGTATSDAGIGIDTSTKYLTLQGTRTYIDTDTWVNSSGATGSIKIGNSAFHSGWKAVESSYSTFLLPNTSSRNLHVRNRHTAANTYASLGIAGGDQLKIKNGPSGLESSRIFDISGVILIETNGAGFTYLGAGSGNITTLTANTLTVNEIYGDVGSVGDPSYTFDNNTTTGFYKSGTDGVGIAGKGEEIALFEDDVFRCRGIYRANTTISSYGTVVMGQGNNPIIGKQTVSSLTLKQDVAPFDLDRALNFVDKAEVIFYRAKEEYQDTNGPWSMIGMGAEPVAAIDEMFALWGMPEEEEDCTCGAITRAIAEHDEAVKTDPNHQMEHYQWQHSNDCLFPYSLKYDQIFMVGFVATQDNRKRIGELEAENSDLKSRLDAIEAKLLTL